MAFAGSSGFAINDSEITNIAGNYYTINTGHGIGKPQLLIQPFSVCPNFLSRGRSREFSPVSIRRQL